MVLKNQSIKLFLVIMLAIGSYCLTIHLNKHVKLQNDDMEAFRNAELEKHNSLRKLHGVEQLQLDSTLNQYAQKYAQELATQDKFKHSDGPYGQNLYMAFGFQQHPNGAASQQWYNEIKDYSWDDPRFSITTGHFTQLIWKGSTRVGFGYAQSQSGKEYVVAEYDPPGNFQGKYEQNVLPK